MAEELNETRIPESVTIGGVSYSVKDTPELQQFLQQVSKVEKTKIYSQIESLKKQLASLSDVQVQPSNDLNDRFITKLQETLTQTFITKEDLQKSLPGMLKEVVNPLLAATEDQKKQELKAYRESLIKANEGTCIPDLVKGNTKEELDASLKESIRLRAAYPPVVEPPRAQVNPPQQSATPTPSVQQQAQPQQTIPQVPNRQVPDASSNSKVKTMSQEEFAKQRDSLKAQIESLYGGSNL